KPPADQSASLASVAGSVVQSDTGAPVANAQVIFTGPIPEGESAESNAEEMRRLGASTDEKGNFTFEKLKPGNYYVFAKHAGMIQKRSDEMGGMTVQLQSGHSQKITVSMLATGVIAGRVLNEQGEPMQSERVTAMQYRYWLAGRRLIEVKTVETNDQGEYRLFGLKPGSYFVLVGSRGSGSDGWVVMNRESSSKAIQRLYAPAYYPNETTAQTAVPIVVKPGKLLSGAGDGLQGLRQSSGIGSAIRKQRWGRAARSLCSAHPERIHESGWCHGSPERLYLRAFRNPLRPVHAYRNGFGQKG